MTNPKVKRPSSQKLSSYLYFSPRLRRLLTVIPKTPLTIVEAPMGYGKTMAIREYAKQFPGKVVWVAAFGRAPEVFWRSLAKELAKVRPELAKPAQALAKLGFPHDHVLAGMAVEILENLTDAAGPILLVFDDCHLLPTSFSAFVDSLAVASQANLRIVCVSRHAWPGQLEI